MRHHSRCFMKFIYKPDGKSSWIAKVVSAESLSGHLKDGFSTEKPVKKKRASKKVKENVDDNEKTVS